MPTRISDETRARIAAVWPDILERIAGGESVLDAAAAHGFKRADLWAFRTGNQELMAAWYDAMKESADAFTDKMLAAIVNVRDAKAARVQVGVLQWLAEKRDPERYGQRIRSDINVKTVDLTSIIRDAQARLEARQNRMIDVTPNNCVIDLARAHAQPAATDLVKALDPALLALL
jgi:hypothetical protein